MLLIALGLGHQAGFAAAAAVLFAVNITAVLPATPANLGVFQAACVAVLHTGWHVGIRPRRRLRRDPAGGRGRTAILMGMPALLKEGMSWREVRLRAMHATPVKLPARPSRSARTGGRRAARRSRPKDRGAPPGHHVTLWIGVPGVRFWRRIVKLNADMLRPPKGVFTAVVAALGLLVSVVPVAVADSTVTVTTTTDEQTAGDACSLREAIAFAAGIVTPSTRDCSSMPQSGTTTILVPKGCYHLTAGELILGMRLVPVVIQGSGPEACHATARDRDRRARELHRDLRCRR